MYLKSDFAQKADRISDPAADFSTDAKKGAGQKAAPKAGAAGKTTRLQISALTPKNGPDKKLPGPVNNNHIMAKTKSVYIVIQVCIVFPDDRLVILVEGECELRYLAPRRLAGIVDGYLLPYISRYLLKVLDIVTHRLC